MTGCKHLNLEPTTFRANCMCRVACKLQSKFFAVSKSYSVVPGSIVSPMYGIMYIVGFGKGLSLGLVLCYTVPSCENCFSLAIRTFGGLHLPMFSLNTLAMITIITGKKKSKTKQPIKTKPRSLKQPNSVGYKLSTNWTVINTLSTVPTKLMSTQESCIPWFG